MVVLKIPDKVSEESHEFLNLPLRQMKDDITIRPLQNIYKSC